VIARVAAIGRWRLATAALASVLLASWVELLGAAALAPCGDFLCLGGVAWAIPVIAGLAGACVWLLSHGGRPRRCISSRRGSARRPVVPPDPVAPRDPVSRR
jgi:hypothetical protein